MKQESRVKIRKLDQNADEAIIRLKTFSTINCASLWRLGAKITIAFSIYFHLETNDLKPRIELSVSLFLTLLLLESRQWVLIYCEFGMQQNIIQLENARNNSHEKSLLYIIILNHIHNVGNGESIYLFSFLLFHFFHRLW